MQSDGARLGIFSAFPFWSKRRVSAESSSDFRIRLVGTSDSTKDSAQAHTSLIPSVIERLLFCTSTAMIALDLGCLSSGFVLDIVLYSRLKKGIVNSIV